MILARKLRKPHTQCSRNFSTLDIKTCIASLQSCAQNQQISEGRILHSRMLVNGHLASPISATSLINMYSKCNSIADALSVFYESTHFHNVFVYNSVIAGLTINNLPTKALKLYREMLCFGIVPDKFTFPCVIKACSDVLDLENVHGMLFKLGLEFDLFVGSALLHCYLKFGLVNEAVQVFEGLPETNDIVIWNAMINGYVQIGEFGKALVIFRRIGENGAKPNWFTVSGVLSALALAGDVYNGKLVHTFAIKMGYDLGTVVLNALIDMYGKCRQLVDAMLVFTNMVEKDMYSWNSIISVHEQCGDHDGTLNLLKQMLSYGFQLDLVTITAAFPACSYLGALMHGKEIHGHMIRNDLIKPGNTYTDNAMMDMYSKCGSIKEARIIFDKMKTKDVASWNIVVMGYGMHGFGNEALDLFSRMCEVGLKPDEVSFVGVLSACNHAGFLTKGQELLAQMQAKYGVTPAIEHYACVIDMLGRAGKLEKAFELISTMSIEPNQVVWRAFLAACRLHGNADMAKVAVKRVFELGPEHCGNYVLMSNIYGEAGKYEEVAELRNSMREQDVKKSPGCSWIELSNSMHVFFTGDRTQPEEYFIYEELDSVTACMREHGYILDVMESYL